MRQILCFLTIALMASAASATDLPAGAAELHAKLNTKLVPSVRTWITQEAQQQRLRPTVDETAVRRAVARRFQGQNLTTGDVDALVMLVMFEVAADEEKDLKSAINEMEAVNQRKKQMREQQTAMKEAQAQTKDKLRQESESSSTNTPGRVMTLRPLPAKAVVATNKNDSLGDMGEAQQLRMQMVMERRSKAIQSLSNLMKKVSETQDTLAQNLK